MAAGAADQAAVGLIASRYRPSKRIGSGSFGEIYSGVDSTGTDKVRDRAYHRAPENSTDEKLTSTRRRALARRWR